MRTQLSQAPVSAQVPVQTILVVDDSRTVQKLVETSFGGSRFRIVTAADGAAGLRLAAETRPDLLLVDLQMTDAYARLFRRRVREDTELARIPLLLVLPRGDSADDLPELAGEGVHCVTKPVDAVELLRLVESLVPAPAAAARPAKASERVLEQLTEHVDRALQQFVRSTLPHAVREAVLQTLTEAGMLDGDKLVLSASIDLLSLPDALNFANHARITGRLTLVAPELLGEVFVDRGLFVFARVSKRDGHEFLTDALLDKATNSTDRQRILRAVATARQQNLRVGASLVRNGVLTEAELMTALETHARRAFHELLGCSRGNFFLQTCEVPEDLQDLTFRLPLMQVLMDGLRQLDERTRARQALADDRVVFVQAVQQDESIQLTEHERLVLARADGKRSLRDLVKQSPFPETETLQICQRLSRVGVLRPKTAAPVAPAAPSAPTAPLGAG
jgi:DNA-binding response OmpR family regulator